MLILLLLACSNGGLWPRIPALSGDSVVDADDSQVSDDSAPDDSAPDDSAADDSAPDDSGGRQDIVYYDDEPVVVETGAQRDYVNLEFTTGDEARWTYIRIQGPDFGEVRGGLFRYPTNNSCGLSIPEGDGDTVGEGWVVLEPNTTYQLSAFGPRDQTLLVDITQPASVPAYISELDCHMVFPDDCACEGGAEGLCNCDQAS